MKLLFSVYFEGLNWGQHEGAKLKCWETGPMPFPSCAPHHEVPLRALGPHHEVPLRALGVERETGYNEYIYIYIYIY